jgi:hypothetical protein
MSGQQRRWIGGWLLSLLLVAVGAASADPATGYEVSGANGAALWGLGQQPGTSALVFAFSRATPVPAGDAAPEATATLPTPGPRAVFRVTQWSLANNEWVEREWYGDWPLTVKGLGIADDLSQGALNNMVVGTLVQYSDSGMVVRHNVPGWLLIKWTASSDPANTTTAYTYQTPAYTAALQTVGSGRMAKATATIMVPALGAPLSISGVGSLSSITTGALNVTME